MVKSSVQNNWNSTVIMEWQHRSSGQNNSTIEWAEEYLKNWNSAHKNSAIKGNAKG